MAERGVVRRPKRKTPRKRDVLGKIDRNIRKSIQYLEDQVDFYMTSAGNADEITRILKTLEWYRRSLQGDQQREAEPAPSPPQPESLRRSFNFDDDDSVEDQAGGPADEGPEVRV